MTVQMAPRDVINKIRGRFPDLKARQADSALLIEPESLLEALSFLKNDPEFDFDYLSSLTAVDYFSYFEVIYQLISISKNQALVVKTRVSGRNKPVIPSVTAMWQGADLQEREAYDLMGITFQGHPNLRRILTWEGFKGHPQRKDYL